MVNKRYRAKGRSDNGTFIALPHRLLECEPYTQLSGKGVKLLVDLFAQFHGKAKAGWTHVRRVRSEKDGRSVVITETESMMLGGPAGAKLKTPIRSSSRFVEDEAMEGLSIEVLEPKE